MSRDLLEKFEHAIRRRNSALADRLLPGLPEARIRRMLDRGKVKGAIEPIVALYSWKNGTQPNAYVTPEQPSLFPGVVYMLAELDLMIAHFCGFKEVSTYHPRYTEVIGRYFPLFWNGSTDFLAVDLEPSSQSRVVVLEKKAEKLVREAYASFEEFLTDAIRANENNDKLSCFQTKEVT
jgi:DNA-binding Lrp family transcriptional regulator